MLREEGIQGLKEKSRKPQSNSKQIPEETICEIIRIKQSKNNWGPKKIRAVFASIHPNDKIPSLSSFERILKKAGYFVLLAESGGEALLIVEQHKGPIHLLLTDVVMPRMSGQILAERLLRIQPDMKVIYMSGYTHNAIAHHGILDEDIPFLEKPISQESLLQKITEVLSME